MTVYFEYVGSRSDCDRARQLDYPRESDTLQYLIKEEVKDICRDAFEPDAVITDILDTVNGNILVQFRFL